jgi:hypothetical protein
MEAFVVMGCGMIARDRLAERGPDWGCLRLPVKERSDGRLRPKCRHADIGKPRSKTMRIAGSLAAITAFAFTIAWTFAAEQKCGLDAIDTKTKGSGRRYPQRSGLGRFNRWSSACRLLQAVE